MQWFIKSYWKCNFPHDLWWVGWALCHNFLKGRTVTLPSEHLFLRETMAVDIEADNIFPSFHAHVNTSLSVQTVLAELDFLQTIGAI